MGKRLAVGRGAKAFLAWLQQTLALQQRADGAGGGPASPWRVTLQNVLELPWSPAHMRLPQPQHPLLDLSRHLVAMAVRGYTRPARRRPLHGSAVTTHTRSAGWSRTAHKLWSWYVPPTHHQT